MGSLSSVVKEMKGILVSILVRMLASTLMTFLIIFVTVLIIGLLALSVNSIAFGIKHADIGPVLLISIVLGIAGVGVRMFIMRKFLRYGKIGL